MQAYRIAVFFAIVGALIGALDTTMAASGHPWWPGTGNTTLESGISPNVTDEQLSAFGVDEQSSLTTGSAIQELSIISVGLNMFKGIFLIGNVVDNMFFGNGNSEVKTAFQPFLNILTIGVDMIYVMAALQIWRKTPLAGAY